MGNGAFPNRVLHYIKVIIGLSPRGVKNGGIFGQNNGPAVKPGRWEDHELCRPAQDTLGVPFSAVKIFPLSQRKGLLVKKPSSSE